MKKVLAIASGGGHWKQLMILNEALIGCDVKYVTTIDGLPQQAGVKNYSFVKDSNKDEPIKVIITFIQLFFIYIKFRPDVVISTGAAPGILAILLGKIFFAKTIWVDSIANGEKLSMGGSMSKKYADVVLTQWEHLSEKGKVIYRGSVF